MIGADALDSWGHLRGQPEGLRRHRPTGGTATAQYIYAGPVLNNTASVCDKWLAVPPTATATFSLALANALIQAGAVSSAPDFADYKALAAKAAGAFEAATGQGRRAEGTCRQDQGRQAPLVVAGASFGQGAGAGLRGRRLLGRAAGPCGPERRHDPAGQRSQGHRLREPTATPPRTPRLRASVATGKATRARSSSTGTDRPSPCPRPPRWPRRSATSPSR